MSLAIDPPNNATHVSSHTISSDITRRWMNCKLDWMRYTLKHQRIGGSGTYDFFWSWASGSVVVWALVLLVELARLHWLLAHLGRPYRPRIKLVVKALSKFTNRSNNTSVVVLSHTANCVSMLVWYECRFTIYDRAHLSLAFGSLAVSQCTRMTVSQLPDGFIWQTNS